MDKKIEKSLFDKNVIGFEYNPQIVSNINTKTIKESLLRNLKEANQTNIAVSYVVWSGLSLIYEELKRFDERSKILLTTEGYVTDPRSLKQLLKLNLEVKVYDPYKIETKGFHLKSYSFLKNDKTTIIIGSNNISARAFGLAHEMAVEIDSKDEGLFVEKYNEAFNKLWSDPASKKLTEDFIEKYEEAYKNRIKEEKDSYQKNLTQNAIKPNYMQEKALRELETARKESNKGLVIAATGTGKTYLSAFDVKNAQANKVLFLVHNRLILTSAIDSYKKIFKDKKSILELKTNNIDDLDNYDFIFTTDKTAYNHLYNNLSKDYFDYIVYDEAHRIGDETLYKELIDYFTPKFSLGITATPERTTNPKYLFQLFDYNVIYEIRLLDAMENELVCPFTYYGLNLEDKLLKENEQFDYPKLGEFLDEIIKEKGFYGEKLKALVFASSIHEAKEVSKALNDVGYNSKVAVSGSATFSDIEDYILSLKSDEKDTVEVICTVNRFNEGIDIPEINTIIMLRNTTSAIIYLQQLGRGLRRTNDPHKYVTVFDIIGNSKNNYTIAEVLTAKTTADKRLLYKHAATHFETVSPYINVQIDEKAMENIIKSISNNFTVKTKIKNKFKEELSRYEEIPTLVEMYNNPAFSELDLLQLTYKNFYEPFERYYYEKYEIPMNHTFLRKLFDLITQFTFRGYNKETLKAYVSLLKGKPSKNNTLKKVLIPKAFKNGITTAINSEYNKEAYNYPPVFKLNDKGEVYLNEAILRKLKELNAKDLFFEHIMLFDKISQKPDYEMKTFSLVDKGEFLFNVGAKDCYMNVVGERIDKEKKVVYCTIKITEKESHYDNYIVDNNKVVYYTQSSNTKEQAINKIEMLKNEDYMFYICAQFPHLGYASTSYFNLGNVTIKKISDVKKTSKGKYNHEIEFLLEKELPLELLMYKDNK